LLPLIEATYLEISGFYFQISAYYCKIGGYLPKSLEMPLNRGVLEREVCAGYLPHTSLIPPSYLPHNRLIVTAYGKFSPINIQLSLGLSQHPHEYLREVSANFRKSSILKKNKFIIDIFGSLV
jgi:hypothetical protein